MSRFDQYLIGARARLAADWLDADVGLTKAVSLNANGLVVKGNPAGSTGIRGVIALGMKRKAGHPVDMMRQGEILDITASDIAGTLVKGAPVFVPKTGGTGALTMTATGNLLVGFLVELDRLVVTLVPDITAGA